MFDGTDWVNVLKQTMSTGAFENPNQQHINITAYANANTQVRFVYDDDNIRAFYWMIDNVAVYNSTCDFPSVLEATDITSSTAILGWMPGGSETNWEVIYQEACGTAPTFNRARS